MTKWRKRILGTFVVVLVLLGVGAGVMFYLSKAKPDWYRSKVLSTQAMFHLQQQANDKLSDTQTWVQDTAAWPSVSTRPKLGTDPTSAPAAEKTITLSEDELNAVLAQWWEPELKPKFGQYLEEPYIALRDGMLIAAVKLKDADRVLSVHLAPKLDAKGMFSLAIDHLEAGRFTVPRVLWSSYTDKLVELLTPQIEQNRTTAQFEGNGFGNESAVASAMTRLLLQSLKGESADAVLFMPADLSHTKRGYPVMVKAIKIEKQAMSLTLGRLSGDEQKHLLERIRAPYGEETPPPITAPVPDVVAAQ